MEQDKDDIPKPTPARDLQPEPDQVIVLVDVLMPPFRERMNNKAVSRTVTVPRWLDEEAKAINVNYSQVLQDGLINQLGIQRQIENRRKSRIPV
jgi:post-segregation antitoxin (ccd killing protein)